ncbi:MAG: P-II family nitrogen regulator, partial [Sphingobacteriia bacterium]
QFRQCGQQKIGGFTVMNIVKGRGRHGDAFSDGVISANENIYLFLIANEEQHDRLLDHIVPLLNTYGGLLFSSDVDLYSGSTP